MKRRTHPTNVELNHWLETERPDSVGRHVEGCGDCMAHLESLTDLETDLVASLNDRWSAPMGIKKRTSAGIENRVRREQALGGFLDLFTIGGDVFRTILDERENLDD